MNSVPDHSDPHAPPDAAAPPLRDLRVLLFVAGFLLLAFCAGMASYAMVKESRRGRAGLLYVVPARFASTSAFRLGS